MPSQSGKSALFAKYGEKFKQAAKVHENDEVQLSGFSNIPENVNGVAQVKKCYFKQIAAGKQNAGEYIWYAEARVVTPPEHEGKLSMISEPVFDTPTRTTRKTMADHLGHIQNELKKMGATDVGPEVIEQTCAAIQELQPFINFRTWKGTKQTTGPYANKEPTVQHSWEGAADFADPNTDPAAGVADASAPGDATAFDEFGGGGGSATAEAAAPAEDGEPDLDALAETAGGDDDEAQAARDQLTAIANAAGIDDKTLEAADKWVDVVGLIRATGEPAAEPEIGAETAPAKGGVYLYKVIDPKTKKPVVDPKTKKTKKPVECEVTAVDAKTRTVTLKNLDDRKTMYKASWDELEG